MSSRFPRLTAQLYFLGLAAINAVHGVLPFFLRRGLYRLCGFEIAPSATVQGGVRFFHVGRLKIGAGTLVNRGVYLDNRAGITIGENVSIAHDVRIYTLGHDVHDAAFAARGKPVEIDDHAVLFAGAMVMPGVHLGRGSVVMAGSVVTRSVAPMRIVGGNPAEDLGERTG
ncbi:MAG: acyltransferase [Caldimonas sp.]